MPVDALAGLAASIGAVCRFAPPGKLDKLIAFLREEGSVFELFEHIAAGYSIKQFADRYGLSVFALNLIYESELPDIARMRQVTNAAHARTAKQKARRIVDNAHTKDGITEAQKRLADSALKLATADVPPVSGGQSVKVNIGLQLGAELAKFHRGRLINGSDGG